MYGHTARNALIRVLKEAPELVDLQVKPDKVDPEGPVNQTPKSWAKIKDYRSRKLADRMLVELWMMGFAVSARKGSDREPIGASRDPEHHKEWRNAKLPPPKKATQTDVEARPPEPAKAP